MVKILTFEKALADAHEHCDDLSVILGNGFSIDYNSTIFDYDSLAEEAGLENLSVGKAELFEALGSSNFEVVIERLRAAATLQELYGGNARLAAKYRGDAKVVRNGLADVLAARHPATSLALTVDEVEHARTFLSHFRRIFTLSYDLLLYWLMNRPEGPRIQRSDGFEWPTAQRSTTFVWKPKPSRAQRVFFLHGALHMFRRDGRLEKLTYWSGGPLVDGLRERLEAGEYPLIVTEGTSLEKESRIDRSPYLRTSLRRFGESDGALFIHGMSLSSNDDHILERIEADTSKIDALYVGIHGDSDGAGAKKVVARAQEVKDRRKKNGGRSLRLRFYRSESANVWRDETGDGE